MTKLIIKEHTHLAMGEDIVELGRKRHDPDPGHYWRDPDAGQRRIQALHDATNSESIRRFALANGAKSNEPVKPAPRR